MRLASVLTPLSDHNLRLAAQVGVQEIVLRCPPCYSDEGLDRLRTEKERVETFGMKVSVVEGGLPFENVKLGNERAEEELQSMKQVLRDLGDLEIPIVCTNFMSGTDWVRTRLDAPQRAGARVTAFDLREASRAVSLDQDVRQISEQRVSKEQLWRQLQRFLEELTPVAEASGVVMALHPDDPPLDEFAGKARILNSVENFERAMALAPSDHNAICFCQGTFAEMGVDIPAAIRRLGPHIRYVHFRDIEGTRENFAETFHDNGMTDMAAAIEAYQDVGFRGPLRPDHVPQLDGEEDGEPGYTMLGRLHAFGYIQGLWEATARRR